MNQPDAAAVSSRGVLLVALAAVLWGTGGVVAKELFGLTPIQPLTVGFFRLALSVPLLLLLGWWWLGRGLLRWHGPRLALILISLAMASYQVCYYGAVYRTGVTVATLITLCLAPLMVAGLSALWLGERLTAAVGRALGLALAGTVLLVGFPAGEIPVAWTGVALALGAALSYAVLTVTGRAIAARAHPFQTIVLGFGGGALLLLPPALGQGLSLDYPASVWLLLLYLGLVPTALAYVLFFGGMRSTPATVASILSLMEPLTATLLAWGWFGERLGLLGLGGAVLLGASLLLLLRRPANA